MFSFDFITLATGITDNQKYEILEAHNRLRSSVAQGQVAGQPSAQNMREMVWDDELAAKAQQWANQCTFQHDPNRYIGMYYKSKLYTYKNRITSNSINIFTCVSVPIERIKDETREEEKKHSTHKSRNIKHLLQ